MLLEPLRYCITTSGSGLTDHVLGNISYLTVPLLQQQSLTDQNSQKQTGTMRISTADEHISQDCVYNNELMSWAEILRRVWGYFMHETTCISLPTAAPCAAFQFEIPPRGWFESAIRILHRVQKEGDMFFKDFSREWCNCPSSLHLAFFHSNIPYLT